MENLKKLRTSCNLTQKEMADKLGMNQQTYANYETGRREPDFDTLKEIASYFNVSIDFLLDIDREYKRNDNFENFSVNFKTAIQLNRKNYYEFVTEWYRYVKKDHLSMIKYETLEQTYSKIYSWVIGESIPTLIEQRALAVILDYPIDMTSEQLFLNKKNEFPKDYNTLKQEAMLYYKKNDKEIQLNNDDYYDYYTIFEHDILIQLNLLKYENFYDAISKKSLQKIQEPYLLSIGTLRDAMGKENEKRFGDFNAGAILLKNKVMQINDESQLKNISRRKHLLMFFQDINITTIDNRHIKQYHTSFLEKIYHIIIDQIKNNQFLYYIVRDLDIKKPINYINSGYNYCYDTFTNLEQAQEFLKNHSIGFVKQLADYTDPIEKANVLKNIIDNKAKDIRDEAIDSLYPYYD
ncbi:MAG: helix-turn-helix domain-containing protein [Clostridium sp.]|nr:helix-turn-helix domain-containing protein [[Clostridium] innocuum]